MTIVQNNASLCVSMLMQNFSGNLKTASLLRRRSLGSSRIPHMRDEPKERLRWAWINSAGRISSRISDIWGEHSAGRIRYFRAIFEQNNGKSVALMICITLVLRKIEN